MNAPLPQDRTDLNAISTMEADIARKFCDVGYCSLRRCHGLNGMRQGPPLKELLVIAIVDVHANDRWTFEIERLLHDGNDVLCPFDHEPAKPPCVGGESVGANRLAAGDIVITRVRRSILLFDDDPGVDGEYRPPSNRARTVNPDYCLGMVGWQRQQASAGAVCRLPISPGFAKPVAPGRHADREKDQQQKDCS